MVMLLAFAVAGLSLWGATTQAQKSGRAKGIEGRWDLTVQGEDGPYPSWFEITRENGQLAGRFTGRVGNARPIARVELTGDQLIFSLPVQYERQNKDLVFIGRLSGDRLQGTTESATGKTLAWTGVRAPELKAPAKPRWGEPIELFNGKDTTGWKLRQERASGCWKVENGLLSNSPPCVDIITEQKFRDFKLHLEFNIAEGGSKGNSGVYLRGRYEVQILDPAATEKIERSMGSVYGFITPTGKAGKGPGEWQTYDIALLGRYVTVELNGQTIINNQAIPGITGGALDSDEGAPGPLMLQGDHGKVSFRKVVLTPAK
jgi:hypothetical protein